MRKKKKRSYEKQFILIYSWVMLTYALKVYDKLPKNRNVAFNDTKNLILR
jgi:hypothetical protein